MPQRNIDMYEELRHIVLTGPESTGKTTLARRLAAHFRTVWVPEYAREYLARLDRPYEPRDLLRIAEGQLIWRCYGMARASRLLISDTDLLVLKVWSDYRYGHTHPWILEQLHRRPAAYYLLCAPDIPWSADPLRENPHDRDDLLTRYEAELHALGAPYSLITGADPEERLGKAIRALNG